MSTEKSTKKVVSTKHQALLDEIEFLSAHGEVFQGEIDRRQKMIGSLAFEEEIGVALTKLGIGRVNATIQPDGAYNFRALKTIKAVADASIGARSSHGSWPYATITYDGTVWPTWSGLCKSLGIDYGADSARRFLEAKHNDIYLQVIEASK